MTVTIAILLGLSLDGFVYMMQIGATVKQLTWKKRLTYAGVYTLISCLSVAIGYGIAVLLQDAMNDRLELLASVLIIFCLGIILMTKGFKQIHYEEKLDKDFDLRKLVKVAAFTNIDTLAVGTSIGFLCAPLTFSILAVAIIAFSIVLLALTVGYNLGASYQRQVSFAGGALMVIFSMWLVAKFLLV